MKHPIIEAIIVIIPAGIVYALCGFSSDAWIGYMLGVIYINVLYIKHKPK